MLRAGLALLLIVLAGTSEATRAQPTENAVKAAFIPKFARYVQWPAAARPGPRDPFNLCVVGSDPFGELLDRAAASEQIEGRAIRLHRLTGTANPRGCHMAFVRGETPHDTARLLQTLRGYPVLTITDSRAGAPRGMIHFTVAAGRVRFFIDEAEARGRGLSISSRLLSLALGVRQRRS